MSDEITIYHNPKCSKSRQALSLLKERAIEPRVVLYLEEQPDAEALRALHVKLGIEAHAMLRTKEAEYKESGLGPKSSEDEIFAAIARYPRLLERPVVVRGERAVIGRPTERIEEMLEG